MKTKPFLWLLPIILIAISKPASAQCSEYYGVTSGGGEYHNGTIFKTDGHGDNLETLYSFPLINEGIHPSGNLCAATNGKYYGVTSGVNLPGTTEYSGDNIYEWDPADNIYTMKFRFTSDVEHGKEPRGSIIQAKNGKLYGTTRYGGLDDDGVIFEWDPETNTFRKLFEFNRAETGFSPFAGLMEAANGKLYGTTFYGGSYDDGVLFEWDPASDTYTEKFSFNGVETGSHPGGSLIQASNGKFFGLASNGGTYQHGVLFEWDLTTNIYKKLYEFQGYYPDMTLRKETNGKLFGTMGDVFFEWDPATESLTQRTIPLDTGDFNTNTGNILHSLTEVPGGKFYGFAISGVSEDCAVLFEWDPATNVYHKKIDFNAVEKGKNPFYLAQADNNRLIGFTLHGGNNNSGVIFEYDLTTHTYTKKIDFNVCESGSNPRGSLIQVNNEKLYGTTYSGGKFGWGVIFECDIFTGSFTKIADFSGKENGSNPYGSMILLNNGKVVGMTKTGGDDNMGVIFEQDTATGALSKKFDFTSAENIGQPSSSLILADNGKLYGITNGGEYNKGLLFEWDPSTGSFTRKLDFNGSINGSGPGISLMKADNGKLIGITGYGGEHNKGVIFEWDPVTDNYEKKLDLESYSATPFSPLIQDNKGKFYGIMTGVGEYFYGTIFEWNTATNIITNRKTVIELWDGDFPVNGSLMLGSNGKIYGSTKIGGESDQGTVFEWDPITNNYIIKYSFGPATGSNPYRTLTETERIINVQACNRYISPSGKYTWTSTGVYKDTISSFAGCDSVITIKLTMQAADATVTQNGEILKANVSLAQYQWIDCALGNSPIAGETRQTFSPSVSGEYAVIISQNGCIDTSACYSIVKSGITTSTFEHNLTLHPNPIGESFRIDLGNTYSSVVITLSELEGRIIQSEYRLSARIIEMKTDASPGLYLVTVTTGNQKAVIRVVKQ